MDEFIICYDRLGAKVEENLDAFYNSENILQVSFALGSYEVLNAIKVFAPCHEFN